MASAINKMAAKVVSSKMPPPDPLQPKTNFDSQINIPATSKAASTGQPSDSVTRPRSGGLSPRKKWQPFATIPPFSRPRDIKDKPDLKTLANINFPTEPLEVFTKRGILSKHQLPISQWPMYTSYLAAVVGSRSERTISTTIDDGLRQAKHDDILDYVYDWAAWAAEIPDEARRTEVLGWVMKTLEQVLKHAIERTGMVLGPNDVKGIKSGTKKTLEGEVKIQIIISSSVKDSTDKKSEVQMKTAVLPNDEPNQSGLAVAAAAAAAFVPSDPNPEVLQSTGRPAITSLASSKRGASEMDYPNERDGSQQDGKRQKTEDLQQQEVEVVEPTAVDDKQEGITASNAAHLSDDDTLPLSPETEQKRARYRQQIFQPRLNHILKRARKAPTRGKCKNWDTVKARLTDAGVSAKVRNMMLRDFFVGYEDWDGDDSIDPNEELALFAQHCFGGAAEKAAAAGKADMVEARVGQQVVAEHAHTEAAAALLSASEELPTFNADIPIPDGFVPAQPPISHPTEPSLAPPPPPAQLPDPDPPKQTPKKPIVTLRTYPSFDPDDYSLYTQYQYENFLFSFTPSSTVKERISISERLRAQVDYDLDSAMLNDENANDNDDNEYGLDPKRQLVRNERGKVVATGNFVDLNSDFMVTKGWTDPARPWLWKERRLDVDWREGPGASARTSKLAGEQLGVKVDE